MYGCMIYEPSNKVRGWHVCSMLGLFELNIFNFVNLLQEDAGSLGSGEEPSDADSLPDDADGLEGFSAQCYAVCLQVLQVFMKPNIEQWW